jgi:hypothetical protein
MATTRARAASVGDSGAPLAALRTGPGRNDFPLCEEVVPGTAQTIWRHLLKDAASVRDGVREAEKCVALLYQVLRWLHERFPNRYPVGKRPLQNWKRLLRAEWESRFGERYDAGDDDGPRFTEDEARKIFGSLAKADPRLALLIEIGPDQRAAKSSGPPDATSISGRAPGGSGTDGSTCFATAAGRRQRRSSTCTRLRVRR